MPADTDEAVSMSLAAVERSRRRRTLPPTVVAWGGTPTVVQLRLPAGAAVTATVLHEDGAARPLAIEPADRAEELEGDRVEVRPLTLPADLPHGWHQLQVVTGDALHTATVIAAPARAPLPPRGWGWMIQLYSVRSTASWGIGDFADLRELASWSGQAHGADFVLCNPLHAMTPVPPLQQSPYYPSSRRFSDPLYLRIEDLPEVEALPPSPAERVRDLATQMQAGNTSARIDRDRAFAAKIEALQLLFDATWQPDRAAAFATYRESQGAALEDFATFCALAEAHGATFLDWPAELRSPDSAAVQVQRTRLDRRVEFFAWLQWLCDEQLRAAQDAARSAGMSLGVVHDLAVGVDPGGADAWSLQADLAGAVTIGAPPDSFNQRGQDWRLAPLRPDRLAADGYRPVRDMLQSVLRHAGGVRIDHILGMFRLWWIPDGLSPAEGTYVRYDAEAMLATIALEAARAGATVIGEDLGTVMPGVREQLAEHRILGSRVMYFEWDGDEALAPERYPEPIFASVTTHDLPTAAGWWVDEEVRTQARLGLLGDAATPEAELSRKSAQRDALLRLLTHRGLVGAEPDIVDRVVGMHALLAQTPSLLVAATLNDAVGDRDQPNLPGTTDEYPSWRLPLGSPGREGRRTVLLDDLVTHQGVRRLVEALARPGSPGS